MLAHNVKDNLADAVAISSTNTVTSSSLPLPGLKFYSIVITTTSTATGTAKLQASVDGGTTWVDLPNSGETSNKTVSGAGSQIWNVSNAAYEMVRVSYTNATNSGTLSVNSFAKS